ncbi:MAG TPA: peptidoglycan synthetase, partial [Prolixibacteraceae bacterium]|nr:peptidoglycan synthetase [Prolixibacteraceae bacterium]
MELHTFSSLQKSFLPQYRNSMHDAHQAFVYFNPHTLEHKRLEPLTADEVAEAFGGDNVQVFTSADALFAHLEAFSWEGKNLLLMTSGNFSGVDIREFGIRIIH